MPSEDLPSFKRPPVIETVLGVQFERLDGLRNAHLGAFWKRLGSEWPKVMDVPPLPLAFERFGEREAWGPLAGQFRLPQDPSARLQIRNAAGDRMIQVQNGRLHYNWLGKAGGPYPRYRTVRTEFDNVLEQFLGFLADEGLGEFRPNQWEVTYVNHLPRGSVWNTPSDWRTLLIGLAGAGTQPGSVGLESLQGEWHFEIAPRRGRLHVQVAHARLSSEGNDEILRLTLTARGPVGGEGKPGLSLDEGLGLGREVIVRTFCDITSDSAHDYWERCHGNR